MTSKRGKSSKRNRKRYLRVITKKYGRPPRKGEVCHHLNEIETDDRPENLVFLPKGLHFKFHLWHKQGTLGRYADEIVEAVRAFASSRRKA